MDHASEVIKLAYKCYQRFGPESTFFRVTGSPDPELFGKGDPNEDFDVLYLTMYWILIHKLKRKS